MKLWRELEPKNDGSNLHILSKSFLIFYTLIITEYGYFVKSNQVKRKSLSLVIPRDYRGKLLHLLIV
jgi:hypothetical protein